MGNLMSCTHDDGAFHDCQYVTERNKLIPAADQVARTVTQTMPDGPDKDIAYGAAFLRAMDSMWKRRGAGAPS